MGKELVSTLSFKKIPYKLDSEWTWYKWSDIIERYQQGLIRSNSELNTTDGVDYFKMNFITVDGSYTFKSLPKTYASDKEIELYKLNAGDFLINVRNSKELVGKSCVIYSVDKEILYNHMLVRIKHKDYITGSFVNAYFNTEFGKKLLDTCKKGTTTVIALYQRDLYDLPIPIPNKEVLNQIDQIYNSINKKIEINNRINAELQAMAKQLYDYWFVQFDFPNEEGKPYKSSGGKMVWNEKLKREIPEGWKVKSIGEYAEVKKGDLITAKNSQIGHIKVVAAGIQYSYTHSEYNRAKNTITISGSGANAGFINFWREPIFASDCITVRGKSDSETIVLLHYLKFIQNYILSQATGSAQPHVYPSDIKILNLAIPNINLIDKFGKIVIPFNEKISNNEKQNQQLTTLRDWLLPLLMSGQVKVKPQIEESVLNIAAEPVAEYEKRTRTIPVDAHILGGHIVNRLHKSRGMGRTKLQKALHLVEYHCQMELNSQSMQFAAGPHDQEMMNYIDQKFFQFQHVKKEKEYINGKTHYKYIPTNRIQEIECAYENINNQKRKEIDNLLDKIATMDLARAEIVSTLYAVWNNRLIAKQAISEDYLLQDFYDWSKHKHDFPKELVLKALDYMREEGITPIGWGKYIDKRE